MHVKKYITLTDDPEVVHQQTGLENTGHDTWASTGQEFLSADSLALCEEMCRS